MGTETTDKAILTPNEVITTACAASVFAYDAATKQAYMAGARMMLSYMLDNAGAIDINGNLATAILPSIHNYTE